MTKRLSEVLRFGLVGILNAALTMAVFLSAMNLGMHYVVASSLAWGIAMSNSFVLNKLFTFRNLDAISFHQVYSHVLSQVAQLILSWCIYGILIDGLEASHLNAYWANFVVITTLNYVLFKRLVFAKRV